MFKKILSICLCLCITFSLAGCGSSTPTYLDFHNYSNTDLFRLINNDVVIYGYFLLNPVENNVAYIAETPYQAISNTQTDANTNYAEINFQKAGIMAVHFKETPEYTSMPIKITGTIEAGPFTDAYYFKYDYRIKNATYEVVDFSCLDSDLQQYYRLAEKGYLDTLYSYFIDMEIFVSEYNKENEVPVLEDYNEIIKELENKTRNTLEEVVYDLFKEFNVLYTTIYEDHNNGTIDTETALENLNDFYNDFGKFVSTYGAIAPQGTQIN